MAIIGLIGPNAVGKTTAVNRWQSRYGDLLKVMEEMRQDSEEEKKEVVGNCRRERVVWVLSSSRTTHLNYFLPAEPVLLVSCSGDLLRENLRRRCEKRGKVFQDAYWHKRKADYEARARYLNWIRRNLDPKQVREFTIAEYGRDWEVVDAYFYSIFPRLNNACRRRPC